MEGVPAKYLGRLVSKEHFRAFIYGSDGSAKLVESWDEFEKHMQTGLWFADKQEPKEIEVIEEVKPKRVRKPVKPRESTLEIPTAEIADVEIIEVKDDDFLPKG